MKNIEIAKKIFRRRKFDLSSSKKIKKIVFKSKDKGIKLCIN